MRKPTLIRSLAAAALALLMIGLIACSSPVSVASVSPAPGAAEVPLDSPIRIKLSSAPSGAGWERAMAIQPDVRGAFITDEDELIFVPSELLSPATTYVVALEHPRLTEGRFSFSFTTVSQEEPDGVSCPDSPSQQEPPEDLPADIPVKTGDYVSIGPLVNEYFQTIEWSQDGQFMLVRVNRGDWVQFMQIAPRTGKQTLVHSVRDDGESYVYVSSLLGEDSGLVLLSHSDCPHRRGLWLVDLEGEAIPLVPEASYYHLSPNGTQLLVEGEEAVIYLDLAGQRRQVLESLPHYGFPYSLPGLAWQPGGRFIAGEIWLDPTQVYVYDMIGREWVTTIGEREHHYHTPVWSPGGGELAYLSQPAVEQYPNYQGALLPAAGVHVKDLQTGAVKSLALRARPEDSMGVLSSPLWSPDGRFLCLTVGVAESHDWHQDVRNEIWGYRWREGRGGLFSLTDDQSGVGLKLPLRFSPDGSTLLFAVYQEGGMYQHHDLWMVRLDTYDQKRVAEVDILADELAWLPDGRLVGAARLEGGLGMRLVMIHPGDKIEGLPVIADWIYSLGVSPDGRYIHAVARTGDEEFLVIIPVT